MAFSNRQKEDFRDDTIDLSALENAWINGNLGPEDVFDGHSLEQWAKENGWMREDDCQEKM